MDTQKMPQRLHSLDALRGFDMFFIIGEGSFFAALAILLPFPFFQGLADQMQHVPWNGFHFEDMIFPLFLFIAGISFPFSLEKQRMQGKTELAILKKIIRRGLTLVLLGILYNGFLEHWDFGGARYGSVLGRIGLAWMFGALIFMKTKTKTRVWITVVILLGYYLMLQFIPVPDAAGAGKFSMEGSLTGYIDRVLMPGKLYLKIHDPEGIFSTLPAIGTALLGLFTGEWIKLKREGLTETHKVVSMIAIGALLILLGLAWDFIFPINKNLWSSSFVCLVGGISMMLFALFYYVIDVKKWNNWTLFFRVIGMNSITIYLAQHFINFEYINERIFGGLINLLPSNAQALGSSVGYIAICWGFLYFLYRQRIFLKV